MQEVADVEIVRRWCRAGFDGLADAREEIDALNVFPVPDGDTGTNLFLTMEAVAAAEAASGSEAGLAEVTDAMARGALLGARGNSGIILAQMLRGVADVFGRPGVDLADGSALAEALGHAADAAYAAVHEPVEGTILTVARAAAGAAAAAGTRGGDPARRPGDAPAVPGNAPGLAAVALAAARAARAALSETPNQLDVLRAAGVVDAGGRGLAVLLDAFDTVLTGRRPLPTPRRVGEHLVPVPGISGQPWISVQPVGSEQRDAPAQSGGSIQSGVSAQSATEERSTPGYEVMYLLDAPDERIPGLRARLAELGASLVVVGGDGQWNVHVHVDDVGAAIEAGIGAGRPYRVRVNHLGPQGATTGAEHASGRTVVAFAAGSGLGELFASAGAVVAASSTGRRPSTAEMLAAVGGVDAGEVVILPNERDTIPVAEAAAAELRSHGRRVAVIPTIAQIQGLAAVAVYEPGRSFDDDVVAMTTAAGHARHGAVTVAAREAVTMAGVCRPGDVLGIVEGDFAVIGSDLLDVARDVVHRMLLAGGELVTVVTGEAADPSLAAGIEEWVRQHHPEVDTVIYEGGQPRYPLLLGVE